MCLKADRHRSWGKELQEPSKENLRWSKYNIFLYRETGKVCACVFLNSRFPWFYCLFCTLDSIGLLICRIVLVRSARVSGRYIHVMLLRRWYLIHWPLCIEVCVAGMVKRWSSDLAHSRDSWWTEAILFFVKNGFRLLLLERCFGFLAGSRTEFWVLRVF